MNDRASELAALPPALRKALEDQRSIDASVRAFERAVWGAVPAPVPRTASPPPGVARTVTPFRPRPAAPDLPAPQRGEDQAAAQPVPTAREDEDSVEADATSPPAAADPETAAPPASGPAEDPAAPAAPAHGDPPAVEAAIRDRLQPHWRDAHERAAEASDALQTAERTLAHAPFLTRLSRKRQRRVEEARRALEEAEAVRTAVDTLWAAESMRRQYALLREAAPATNTPDPT